MSSLRRLVGVPELGQNKPPVVVVRARNGVFPDEHASRVERGDRSIRVDKPCEAVHFHQVAHLRAQDRTWTNVCARGLTHANTRDNARKEKPAEPAELLLCSVLLFVALKQQCQEGDDLLIPLVEV